MRLLITGGTGTIGRALVRALEPERGGHEITVYSRDELKQWEMRQEYPDVRYVLGNVRDVDRLTWAMRGTVFVIHAAALKYAPALERDPTEVIQTNVAGSRNVIDAAARAGVQKVVAISTDKAAGPVTAYGASKLLMERMMGAADVDHAPTYACVRLGNVIDSSGSVVRLWKRCREEGRELPITDLRMTRHWMARGEAAWSVLRSVEHMRGGEVFVPKPKSFRLVDLWCLLSGLAESDAKPTGARPGEKLHEQLLAPEELPEARDLGTYCVLYRDVGRGPDYTSAPKATSPLSSVDSPMTREELAVAMEAVP